MEVAGSGGTNQLMQHTKCEGFGQRCLKRTRFYLKAPALLMYKSHASFDSTAIWDLTLGECP
jgi:hypothetical protein